MTGPGTADGATRPGGLSMNPVAPRATTTHDPAAPRMTTTRDPVAPRMTTTRATDTTHHGGPR